jgi:ABC-type sugar transport system ATPase subunit
MIVQASRITKSFGPTVALSDGSVTLRSGEIHALVGENGAGKSTLLKVIAGYERGDAGAVTIDGEPFAPASASEAARRGVVLVMQELTISHALGIAENVFIDRLRDFTTRWGLIDRRRLQAAAQRILDEIGSDLSVLDDLESLELGQLKILEVARAISHDPRVLLLDESTAFLNTTEVDELLRVMQVLKSRGLVVGFVSHHLDEVQKVADRVTILKDGAFVGEFESHQIDRKQIESLMVGREATFSFAAAAGVGSPSVALELRAARFAGMPRRVSLDLSLRETEVLGIGGLQGSGGHALLEGIIGERRLEEGAMALFGRPYAPVTPHDAWQAGIAYLPGDRTNEGLITEFSVQENLVMPRYPRFGPFLDRRAAATASRRSMEEFRIKARDPSVPCIRLSGGNMQKTLLAKCLFAGPRVLLLNNPTRGVDIASRFEIYQKIRDLVRDQRISVILLTEDLIELLGMSDRILVMNKGHIRKQLLREDAPSEGEVVSYMV